MRRFLTVLSLMIACKSEGDARCAHCGMKIQPNSSWSAQIDGDDMKVERFDTPRCALTTWLESGKHGTVRVQDYYDRKLRPAGEVRFVVGSDVVGPMGPDLVPVDMARVAKFEKDHGSTHDYALGEIDQKALEP